jgi:hypothetical protein
MNPLSNHWPSTKALSVHNALLVNHRDMTGDEILAFLRTTFDKRVDAQYVAIGITFLVERGFATTQGTLVVANRAIGELLRTNNDADLMPSRIPRRRSPRTALTSHKG